MMMPNQLSCYTCDDVLSNYTNYIIYSSKRNLLYLPMWAMPEQNCLL